MSDSPLTVAAPTPMSEGVYVCNPLATPTHAWKIKRSTQEVPRAFSLMDGEDEDEDDGVDDGVRALTRVLEGVRL